MGGSHSVDCPGRRRFSPGSKPKGAGLELIWKAWGLTEQSGPFTAIFLPLGFLTGLLGVNVGGIRYPEDTNGFALFAGLLGIVTLVLLAPLW